MSFSVKGAAPVGDGPMCPGHSTHPSTPTLPFAARFPRSGKLLAAPAAASALLRVCLPPY
eukprot:1557977-Prorocentrum_lima.AAC.1